MKIVLDTNILLAIIGRRSPYRWLFDCLIDGRIALCVSNEILLEYEEVLNHKLQPERWGWAAIHLCNLYFKLNQEEKGYTLLRRIVKEYPQTPAAEKARKRLSQVDGAAMEQLATESNVRVAPTREEPEDSGPPSNLPPGFRPKK